MLFAWVTDPNAWLALGTLTLLEIVLGIDNIICQSQSVSKGVNCPFPESFSAPLWVTISPATLICVTIALTQKYQPLNLPRFPVT